MLFDFFSLLQVPPTYTRLRTSFSGRLDLKLQLCGPLCPTIRKNKKRTKRAQSRMHIDGRHFVLPPRHVMSCQSVQGRGNKLVPYQRLR